MATVCRKHGYRTDLIYMFNSRSNSYFYGRCLMVKKQDHLKWGGELKKRLEKSKLDGRIAGVETVDKMTNRQIAVKVRQYFAKPVQK